LGAVALLIGLPSGARAEIALLTNGDFLKVSAYELRGEKMRLELANGGALLLDLNRVERIIDDEIEPAPELPEAPAPAIDRFVLRWDEGQRAVGPHAELLDRVAADYGINPTLMSAMARAESNDDPRALSHKGARGLLQLMPATAERFGIDPANLWDPLHNATASARYLRFLIERFDGQLDLVLAGYNAGEGAVDRYGGVPPYKETHSYIARIRRFLELEPRGTGS
jgi:soluble lytic murein transglycosylase-like protein